MLRMFRVRFVEKVGSFRDTRSCYRRKQRLDEMFYVEVSM
jgi:hypothetical protein